ncbi:uncharacterized protein [Solanum lycopersicum]|uniref:uncharacterized protein n=1 Tax=Solanum lycopersicum TaxID=4081 RepID=UPI00374A4A98
MSCHKLNEQNEVGDDEGEEYEEENEVQEYVAEEFRQYEKQHKPNFEERDCESLRPTRPQRFSRRSIELDLSKIKAIQKLRPTKIKKKAVSFLGRLNYISWFIAQSTVVYEPIFKLLKKDSLTKWSEECQTTFDAIKNYSSNPLLLVSP